MNIIETSRPDEGLRLQRRRGPRAARHRPEVARGEFVALDRPVGLGQVDPDGDPRAASTRRPPGRYALDGEPRRGALGTRARANPQREGRLRLPELQPASEGLGRAQRRAADALRRRPAQERRGAALGAAREGRHPGEGERPPGGALGRPAAARRDRARAREPARAPPRRRADRRARLEDGRRGARALPGAPPPAATPSSSSRTTPRSPPWRSARSSSTTA